MTDVPRDDPPIDDPLADLFDEPPSADRLAELERGLAADPALVADFVSLCLVESLLAESHAAEPAPVLPTPRPIRPASQRRTTRSTTWIVVGVAAACLLAVGLLLPRGGDGPPVDDAEVVEFPPPERPVVEDPVDEPEIPANRFTFLEKLEPVAEAAPRLIATELAIRNPETTAVLAAALLLPAVQQSREAARRTATKNQLKQIGIALHAFRDIHGAFPAAYNAGIDRKANIALPGTPRPALLSWRVHLLPFIEQKALYEQFHLDEPWDSPHNKPLVEAIPAVYQPVLDPGRDGTTAFLAIRTPQCVLIAPPESAFGKSPPLGLTLDAIRDGTSNTAVVVLVDRDHRVPWTKPDDFVPDADDPRRGLAVVDGNSYLVLFADTNVQSISRATPVDVLRGLFTRDGREHLEPPSNDGAMP